MASLLTNSIRNAIDGVSSAFIGAGLGNPSYAVLNTTGPLSLFPASANTAPAFDTPIPFNAAPFSAGLSLVPTGATASLSSASGNGFVITYTYATAGANTYSVGQVVNITGFGQAGYNIKGVVTTAFPNTFTLAGSQTGASTGTGTATQISTRILASRSGVYQIDGNFMILNSFSTGNQAETFIYVRINGTTVPNSNRTLLNFGNGVRYGFSSSWSFALNSGDFVELVATFPAGRNIISDVFIGLGGAGGVPNAIPAQVSIQQIA